MAESKSRAGRGTASAPATAEVGGGPGDEAAVLRRAPVQQRSRDRVERILSIASGLIAEKGSQQLKMSDVASLADISIGSLYQYFPDKGSVLRTLAERYNAIGRACIEQGLAKAQDMKGLCAAFSQLIDEYYGMFLAEPVMRDIWSGMQADRELAHLELAESRVLGALLADAARRVCGRSTPADIQTASFLLMHLGEATMRLAISLDRAQGKEVVDAYKDMALREIASWDDSAAQASAPGRAKRATNTAAADKASRRKR